METAQLQYLTLILANRVIARKPAGVSASDFALSLATKANTLQRSSLCALLFDKNEAARNPDTLAEILAYRGIINEGQHAATNTAIQSLHHAHTTFTSASHRGQLGPPATSSKSTVLLSETSTSPSSQQNTVLCTTVSCASAGMPASPIPSHTASPLTSHVSDKGQQARGSTESANLQQTTASQFEGKGEPLQQHFTDAQPQALSMHCQMEVCEEAAAQGSLDLTPDQLGEPVQLCVPVSTASPHACGGDQLESVREDELDGARKVSSVQGTDRSSASEVLPEESSSTEAEDLPNSLLTRTSEACKDITNALVACLTTGTVEPETDSKDALANHRLAVSMASSAIAAVHQSHAIISEIADSDKILPDFTMQTRRLLEGTVNSCLDLLYPAELAAHLRRRAKGTVKRRKLSDMASTLLCSPRTVSAALSTLVQAPQGTQDLDVASIVGLSCSRRIRDLATLAPHRICNPALQLIRTLCAILEESVAIPEVTLIGREEPRALEVLRDCQVWLTMGTKSDSQFRRACRKRVMRTIDHIQANL